ncbi:MAG: SurA N-terminal domain [Frankiales bacterium]|nr:SurA N-terminal domain [Frankiales bacterium]
MITRRVREDVRAGARDRTAVTHRLSRKDSAVKATFRRQFALPLVLVAFVATGCGQARTGQVAGSVGDHEVTTAQLADISNQTDTSAMDANERAKLEQTMLSSLLQLAVFRALADKEGITVTQADLDASIAAKGGRDAIFAGLDSANLPHALLPTIIESITLDAKLEDKWLPVTDDVLRATYDKNIDTYRQIEITHVAADSEAQANEIAGKLRAAPGTFTAIAAEYFGPDAPPVSTGLLPKSKFPADLGNQLWAAKQGDVLVINTEGAWRVLLVTQHVETPFADARAAVLQTARGTNAAAEFTKRLAELRKTDPIVVNPRFGDWDPDNLAVIPGVSETVRQDDVVSAVGNTDPLSGGFTDPTPAGTPAVPGDATTP